MYSAHSIIIEIHPGAGWELSYSVFRESFETPIVTNVNLHNPKQWDTSIYSKIHYYY